MQSSLAIFLKRLPQLVAKSIIKKSFFIQAKFRVTNFFKANWKGTVVILLATLVFFWPLVTKIGNYSVGGDAMFNAWTLARDQHCILHQNCPHYADGNIYFPNKDSMLYSETQLSAGFISLPLYFINQNPIFSFNVMTILSFFLGGWFMYLLAKYLSKGNELFSILAGLIFEFAPFRMAAIWHLQNLSIFCLPLAVLLVLKYFKNPRRKYLWLLFLTLLYQFYASWYQMVFMLVGLAVLVVMMLIIRQVRLRPVLIVGLVTAIAIIATLPLAKQYVQFSKTNKATFGVVDQSLYSSSVEDYFKPYTGSLLGKIYYKLRPHAAPNAFNLDSYSYHGIVLYAIAVILLTIAYKRRKKTTLDKQRYKLVLSLAVLAVVGFIISLGPLLKLRGTYIYGQIADGTHLAIPAPYILVDKFLPQFSFIRAIGRASVLTLFALCCLLALFPLYVQKLDFFKKRRSLVGIVVTFLVVIELLPAHLIPLNTNKYAYNLDVPPIYSFIKAHRQIDNIIILQHDNDYPNAPLPMVRAENVLWAGYYNRNIYNGYSGYTPPNYDAEYADFINFAPNDVPKMKKRQLRYVIVDKLLSKSLPTLNDSVAKVLHNKIYEDSRYALYKI